jgi:hypothetical protein
MRDRYVYSASIDMETLSRLPPAPSLLYADCVALEMV